MIVDTNASEPITLIGACHCGAVRFTVTLTEGFASARRCTCSICRMRGAVAVTSTPDVFHITQGADKLATYRFNTKTAEHHFCSVCGIYTHLKLARTRVSSASTSPASKACRTSIFAR